MGLGLRGGGESEFSNFRFSCSMVQEVDGGSGNHVGTNRTCRSGDFGEYWPISGASVLPCVAQTKGSGGAARGRGRSASGSRSAAAGPRRRHVVTRWSKLRAAARPQWQQRSSRGRRSVALWLWEAAQAYPRREAISAASRASMACHAGERGRAEASGQDEAQRARRRREARPPTIRGAHPRATSPAGRRSRCATAKGRGGCCCCRCCRCCSYRCCHRCCRCCRCCCCYRCRRRRCQSSWPAFHHIVH